MNIGFAVVIALLVFEIKVLDHKVQSCESQIEQSKKELKAEKEKVQLCLETIRHTSNVMKERFIKSRERVRKYGEVYTPDWLVKDMCDMLSEEGGAWSRLDETFLEPACGTGNFLVEILERKFRLCKDYKDGLKALSTIWGIDILPDNVQESRVRMLNMYKERYSDGIDEAARILEENIICGDSLKIMKQWADEEKENECEKTERTY